LLVNGIDVVGLLKSWGFEVSGVSLQGTLVGMSYAVSQLTKPMRIVLFLTIAPALGYWVTKDKTD